MAMHEVDTGVVRLEAQGHKAASVDLDRIATDWVGMRRRQDPSVVVSLALAAACNDLECGAVKMPRMAAGLRSGRDAQVSLRAHKGKSVMQWLSMNTHIKVVEDELHHLA